MIPLHQFLPSVNRRSGEQKAIAPSSRKRQRSDNGSSNGEQSATPSSGSKQKGVARNTRVPLMFQSAPVSDESDFDRDSLEEDEQLKPAVKKKNGVKATHSGKSKKSLKHSITNSNEQSSADELEVENEDSQTFAVFKMRTAVQEQARKDAERESRRISKQSYSDTSRPNGKKRIAIHNSPQNDLLEEDTHELTQSVKLSKRTRLGAWPGPSSTEHVSLPFQVMQRQYACTNDDEDVEDVESEVESEGKDDAMAPANRKTLLDLLVRSNERCNASSAIQQQRRGSRSKGSDIESGSEASSGRENNQSQATRTAMRSLHEDDSSDDDNDNDNVLRFDTSSGELIRPVRRKVPSASNGALEPGQSEEEDDYVPTLADAPRPSKKDAIKYWADERKRVQLLTALNTEAEAKAKELGMKPAFRCSAEKQRKKPYSLDPNDAEVVIPISISRFLRRYQRIGVQFFYDRYVGIQVDDIGIVRGGVLGDDMGLGKTIQVLAFLSAVMAKKGTDIDMSSGLSRKYRARRLGGDPLKFGPTCLITCPKTLVTNWKREIETWTNLEFDVIDSRADKDKVIGKYKNGFLDLDVVLVSFDRLVSDIDVLKTLKFSIMIIDEAHSIKNPKAARTLAMKSIVADCKFAMTGTLIQNRYQEMWSVLDFAVPGLIGDRDQWKSIVADPVDAGMDQKATIGRIAEKKRVTDILHRSILPLLFLRRTKAEVALELPTKNDQVVFCPLTAIQQLVYRRVAAQPELQAFLARQAPCPEHQSKPYKDCCGSSIKFEQVDKGIVFRYIDIFKKVASHIGLVYSQPDDKPDQKALCQRLLDICFPLSRDEQLQSVGLLGGTELEGYIKEERADIAEELGPIARDSKYRSLKLYQASATPEFSGKWLILHSLLRSWRTDDLGNHKVLVFSSSVKLLEMLHEFIRQEYNCEMLHGGIKDEERMAAVDRFQNDKNVFVFLISTLAGGVGLNLTAANKVIIFDPNWNPANDLQAMDRAFRMGQKRDVDVYRLISMGTIEENIYERQIRKSAAMRIIYDNATESREFVGSEGGEFGDLWGATNLFTYNPDGTSLQRKAKLAFEEEQLERNLGGIDAEKIVSIKINTSYGEGMGDFEQKGTEKGTEMVANVTEDSTLLEAIGDLFPGLRREGVAKPQNKSSIAEPLLVEQAVRDAKNPAIANRRANEYYKSEAVAKRLAKQNGRVVRRTNGAPKTEDGLKMAPRLNLPKSERHTGLVSDDE